MSRLIEMPERYSSVRMIRRNAGGWQEDRSNSILGLHGIVLVGLHVQISLSGT